MDIEAQLVEKGLLDKIRPKYYKKLILICFYLDFDTKYYFP